MHELFTFTHGAGQSTNEDALITCTHPDDPSLVICVLADGQGGRSGAADAARLACEVAIEGALNCSPRQISRSQKWEKIVGSVDRTVYDAPNAGFTTVVALCIAGNTVYGASSGDSAALLFNTRDRVHVMTEYQKKNPPIGSGNARIVSFQHKLVDPWQVLLMSDGVWKYVGWKRVRSLGIRHSGQATIDALTAEARSVGNGQYIDDLAIIAICSAGNNGQGVTT